MNEIKLGAKTNVARRIAVNSAGAEGVGISGHYKLRCHRPDGALVWRREIHNLVTTAGLNSILTQYFKGASYTAAFYMGLFSDQSYSAVALGDTLGSHAGWVEWEDYTGDRKAITFGTASGGVLASSSIPTFTVSGATGTETLKGAFVATTTDDSGVLVSVGLFDGGDAPVANGYVITGEYEITLANAA